MKSTSISKIEKAGLGWRVFSGIVDGLLLLFTWFVLSMWVFTPIAESACNYSFKMSLGSHYQVASHLFLLQQTDDDGNFVTIEVKDFTEKLNNNRSQQTVPLYNYDSTDITPYVKRIYYYYHNFKCARDIELPNPVDGKPYDPFNDYFVDPEYNQPIKDVLRENYYTDEWFLNDILEMNSEKTYFFRDTTKEGNLPEQIVLKEGANKDEALKLLKNKAYDASGDQYYAKYYYDNNEDLKRIQLLIAIPPFVIGFGAFFFLPCLIRKDGATLGKMMNHLAVIGTNGYQAKKRQIVFRQLIYFFLISLSLVIIGIGLTSLATCGVMILILFVCTLISKSNRSPADYAAMTIVVDARKSVWFENAEEEARKEKELEDNMSKYKNVSLINENVIQIGTEIIDENFKNDAKNEKDSK